MTRILAKVNLGKIIYLLSFSQILDFIYWTVWIFILIYFKLRDHHCKPAIEGKSGKVFFFYEANYVNLFLNLLRFFPLTIALMKGYRSKLQHLNSAMAVNVTFINFKFYNNCKNSREHIG